MRKPAFIHTSKLIPMVTENYFSFMKLCFDNPYSSLQIKYKEEWEKTKSKACDIGVDVLSVKAAKASRDLASDVSKHALFSDAGRYNLRGAELMAE